MIDTSQNNLHAGECGFCEVEVEAPKMSLYNPYCNKKVKLCSIKCYNLYMGLIEHNAWNAKQRKLKVKTRQIKAWEP
jgi:hypothetical protein